MQGNDSTLEASSKKHEIAKRMGKKRKHVAAVLPPKCLWHSTGAIILVDRPLWTSSKNNTRVELI